MNLFISDFDGTFKKKMYYNLEKNKEAVSSWTNKGNEFGIATGRSVNSIKDKLIENKVPYKYIIGNNGGIVVENGETIFVAYIESGIIEEILSTIPKGSIFESKSDGKETKFKIKKRNLRKIKLLVIFIVVSFFKKEKNKKEIKNKEIVQISVAFNTKDEAKKYDEYINSRFGNYVTSYQNDVVVDIIKKGISKATGIEEINKNQFENIFTIGDNFNDISMLKKYDSFAMDNGELEVQKSAKRVVGSVSEAIEYINMNY